MLAVAATFAPNAYAQDSDRAGSGEGRGLEEIIVTAQKRAEALSDAAAAVSVFDQTIVDALGGSNFGDVVSTIPNVSANGLGRTIAIRGLGTNTLGQGNGTVAYHIDGIFQASRQQSESTLYDIARVEVLRGPQGTLYGRNATAGVVNVITNNANLDGFEAFGDVSYGRWSTFAVRGGVNVPFGETLAVRLISTYEKSDSWMRLASGKRPGDADMFNIRLALRAQPSDSLTWDARVTYSRDNVISAVAVPTFLYNKTTSSFVRSSNPRNVATVPVGSEADGLGLAIAPGLSLPSVYKGLTYKQQHLRPNRIFAIRSNLNFELSDALSLTYLLGYSREIAHPGVIGGLQPFQVNYAERSKEQSWSHELNLNYEGERLHGIFGAYSFENSKFEPDQLTRIFQPTIDASNLIRYTVPAVDAGTVANGPTKSRTRAIYGQATFDLTDRFRVTGGARYNWDRASFSSSVRSLCPFGSGASAAAANTASAPAFFQFPPGTPLCTAFTFIRPANFFLNRQELGGSKSFEKFSWKATVEYDLSPETMAYATVATGYKAGGPGDTSAVGDARFFRPETNINYEAGIRSSQLDNTLTLNLTAFWTDYKDLQIETTNPSRPNELVRINAGKSRSRGLEFEYAWAPTRKDRIQGYIAYLDAKFTDFPGRDELTEVVQNFDGNRLPGAPELSARLSYSHIFDLVGSGTITPTASIYYQSKAYVSFTNSLVTKIPGYTRSDVIVRYETASKNISVEAYVNNIENKSRLTQIFPQFNVANGFFSPPRSYGVRVGFRY